MVRQDDPSIAGGIVFYRRVPPWPDNTKWGTDGVPTFTSGNFRDKFNELSVNMAHECSPETALAGHSEYGLISITAGEVRLILETAVICRDHEDPANGHVLICHKVTQGQLKALKKKAQWVSGRWPARKTFDDIP
jgi:hypothetical protein